MPGVWDELLSSFVKLFIGERKECVHMDSLQTLLKFHLGEWSTVDCYATISTNEWSKWAVIKRISRRHAMSCLLVRTFGRTNGGFIRTGLNATFWTNWSCYSLSRIIAPLLVIREPGALGQCMAPNLQKCPSMPTFPRDVASFAGNIFSGQKRQSLELWK